MRYTVMCDWLRAGQRLRKKIMREQAYLIMILVWRQFDVNF